MKDPESSPELVEIARYPRLSAARDAALALSACELPYWIEPQGSEWSLRVEPASAHRASTELAAFQSEERMRAAIQSPSIPLLKTSPVSLFVFAWILAGAFALQLQYDPSWTEHGAAVSREILRGEWWRVFTALTLHADLMHLTANIATGLLFGASLLPHFGTGCTWLFIVLTGALGNALNAWGYRGEAHASIGASTAVFGALGLLVGRELWAKWSHQPTRTRRDLIIPLGAGLALLAFLGVGEARDRVDIWAHAWGFFAGVLIGCPAGALIGRIRSITVVQRAGASLAGAILILTWALALR